MTSATDELRKWGYGFCGDTHDVVTAIADRIDAEHAQLERDYKVACEVNERQDEQYADMVHKLDRAYEKNRNQRKQLTEVQEALHRRNEGELKRRWMREKQDLELQIAKMHLESVELPKDADGEYIHIGDVMEWYDSGETLTVEGIGRDVLFYIDGENAEWTAARNKRHHHAPTVEDVLREFTDEVWNRCCEGATASDSGIDELVAEYAAKLRLAGDAE